MNESLLTYLLISFAVYRITHLISMENGPKNLIDRFRSNLRLRSTFFYDLISCFLCLSVWVSIPFSVAISDNIMEAIFNLFAISGISIFIFKISNGAAEN